MRISTLSILVLPLVSAACGDGEPRFMPPPVAPIGAISASWGLFNASGLEISCDTVGADLVTVSVGGASTEVACDSGIAVIDQLPEGAYPVVASLRVGPVIIARAATNTAVRAGQTTEVALRFELERTREDRATALLRWHVDFQPAGARCEEIGAETVQITTRDTSIAPVEVTVPCAAGAAELTELAPGGYTFRLRLFDGDGERLDTQDSVPVRLLPGSENTLPWMEFVSPGLEFATIHASYTIDGDAPERSCGEREVAHLMVRLEESTGSRLVATASAACERGSLSVGDLVRGRYETFLELADHLGRTITSTRTRGIALDFGQTATIAADLQRPTE